MERTTTNSATIITGSRATTRLTHCALLLVTLSAIVGSGCDGAELREVNWSTASSSDTLTVIAGGFAVDLEGAVITFGSEGSSFKIRAQALNGEAFSLDLNGVDGPGQYFVAPLAEKSASSYYVDAIGDIFTVRERSSQVVEVTAFSGSTLAGVMNASAQADDSRARYLQVYFSFRR